MKIQSLKVNYGDREVGTLALYKDYFAAFQYSKEWLETGFSISPFSLPLKEDLFIPKMEPFSLMRESLRGRQMKKCLQNMYLAQG